MERSPNTGMITNVTNLFDKATTLELFKRICTSRAFEMRTHQVFDTGVIKAPIYLSYGQEAVAAALSLSFFEDNPDKYAQHRAHDLYLCYGGNPIALVDELLGLPTGCSRGWGGSASIQCPEINMHWHDGLMGSQVPIAVGDTLRKKRLGINRRTLSITGDASAEEDYVLTSLAWASTKNLPILFICNDNGLSVLTEVGLRRNWSMTSLAEAFKIPAIEIADDPWLVMHHVKRLAYHLPALINIQICRGSSHAGTRKDNYKTPEWNRYALIQGTLNKLGLMKEAEKIEKDAIKEINFLWDKRLKETSNVS